MPFFDLPGQAGLFADQLTDLLNASICSGVRLKSVISQPGRAVIGYRITKDNFVTSHGIRVSRGKKPSCHLGLSYRLQSDAQQQYLMVTSSFLGLFADESLDEPLLHYDYERDKRDGYPEAHLQIHAVSEGWDTFRKQAGLESRPLAKLHLPVGGRRYRPTLEDLIEFLACEGLADVKPGWKEHVDASRESFQRRQLRAAVRRDPDAALDILRSAGSHLTRGATEPAPAPCVR